MKNKSKTNAIREDIAAESRTAVLQLLASDIVNTLLPGRVERRVVRAAAAGMYLRV